MMNFNRKPSSMPHLDDKRQLGFTTTWTDIFLANLKGAYIRIIKESRALHVKHDKAIPDVDIRNLLCLINSFLSTYSLLVMHINFCLEEGRGNRHHKAYIHPHTYAPNTTLQQNISRSVLFDKKATAEKPLNRYLTKDPILQLHYEGHSEQWTIKETKDGYSGTACNTGATAAFDIKFLTCELYVKGKPLKLVKMSIFEIWQDILEMKKLIEDNVADVAKREHSLVRLLK
ncbi:hypothetical protein F0L74_17720 [Chitinophaga agrisoli]|uniref:Uncharacterized protein n=1 Tax=Chitinophaga agrisoli TaxID=2607653 RepID=A0A5B2VPM9_9BACT|nr:hypothetical protein [Chitinophaga agrisoli]KAA2241713.1 hypothetical protein F0L74_17720 [Chitinophaga agrisoli]